MRTTAYHHRASLPPIETTTPKIFNDNCDLLGFPSDPATRLKMFNYKTPGRKAYERDIRNYTNYMRPILSRGIEKRQAAKEKKRIVYRSSAQSQVVEEEAIENSQSSTPSANPFFLTVQSINNPFKPQGARTPKQLPPVKAPSKDRNIKKKPEFSGVLAPTCTQFTQQYTPFASQISAVSRPLKKRGKKRSSVSHACTQTTSEDGDDIDTSQIAHMGIRRYFNPEEDSFSQESSFIKIQNGADEVNLRTPQAKRHIVLPHFGGGAIQETEESPTLIMNGTPELEDALEGIELDSELERLVLLDE